MATCALAGPRRRAAAVLLLAALLLAIAAPAWPHAVLIGAAPADGAALESSPDTVVLRFNEVVTPVTLRIIDGGGRVVAAASALPAADILTVAVPAGLPAGAYVVAYRVVSADAHPVGGAVMFTIGAAADPPAEAMALDLSREAGWRMAAMIVRGLRDAALLFGAGGALFLVLLVQPRSPTAARLAPALRAALALAALLSIVAIGLVGGLATLPSSLLETAPWRAGLDTTAAASGFTAAAASLGLAAVLAARGAAMRAAAIAAALAALSGPILTGHAATAGPAQQAIQALHMIAAGYWIGGLWPLLAMVRGGDPGAPAAARRFGALAFIAVAVLPVAGAALALDHAGSLRALVGSDYGLWLGLKTAGFAALLALAAVNRRRLVPRLASDPRARHAFAGTLRADLVLAAATLAATAVLVHTPPPHDPARHDHPHAPTPGAMQRTPGVTVVAVSDRRSATIDVDPGRAGRNTITLAFAEGLAAFAPREVRVELAQPAAGVEPIVRAAAPTGDGRFRIAGPELALPGTWSLRIEALVSDFEKAIFETRVTID